MTDEHKDRLLADCLEDFHRQRARGEIPDLAAFRDRLGDLYGEFQELVQAETAIDEALEPASDAPLPLAWGKYTILREIARGAAGVVYEALHRELGRKVALKVLRTGLDTDDVTRERFRREAQALAQVRHDHIVEIYEFGEVDDRPYYAMSLVDGPTLADLVKQDALPEPREVCRGLADVVNALQTLHEAGIIHRDVKPSNIMIDRRTGRYMLADFGLARTAMSATVTRTGDALGTPLYMSPEQMLGNREAIEARTDIYGLGATLYQLLTGQPPFKTDNLHALMRMVLSQRPEPATSVKPDLPTGVNRIAMKCLEKEARDRYASAAELERDMRAFAEGRQVQGKPLTPWQRSVRLVVKHPVLAAAATVLLGFGVWLVARPPDPAHLTLTTTETAQVQLGAGGPLLRAPLVDHELEPKGKFTVHIQPDSDEFLPTTVTVDARPNSFHSHSVLIQPRDPNNVEAYQRAARSSDVDTVEGIDRLRGTRRAAPEGPAIELWFPRGKVRRADLARYETWVTEAFPLDEGGRLEFRAGDETLGSLEFPPPEEASTSGAIAPDLLDKIRVGMVVTWRYVDAKGKPLGRPATFELTDVDLEERFATIDEKLAGWTEEGRRIFAATLRAELLVKHGLYGPAYQLLRPLAEAGSATQRMALLQKLAVTSLFPDAVVLREVEQDWQLWSDVLETYNRFDGDDWERYFQRSAQR